MTSLPLGVCLGYNNARIYTTAIQEFCIKFGLSPLGGQRGGTSERLDAVEAAELIP